MDTLTDLEHEILRYAADAAFVAEVGEPATTITAFVEHLTEAAETAATLDLPRADELELAAALLNDIPYVVPEFRPVLLARAANRLRHGREALEQYRLMA